MQKSSSNTAARAPAHCTFTFRNNLVVGGMPIGMYEESWFMDSHADVIIVLYMVNMEPLT